MRGLGGRERGRAGEGECERLGRSGVIAQQRMAKAKTSSHAPPATDITLTTDRYPLQERFADWVTFRCCRWNSETNIWRQAPFLIERVPTVLRLDPARENGRETGENALREGRVRPVNQSEQLTLLEAVLELTWAVVDGFGRLRWRTGWSRRRSWMRSGCASLWASEGGQ